MELKIEEIENIPENITLKKMHNKPKPKISYENILSNMGMFVSNGQLHLIDRDDYSKIQSQSQNQNQSQSQSQSQNQSQNQRQNPHQNNYIYNKYFKDVNQIEPTIRRPKTLQEYKIMLAQDYIQKQHIKQIKSTKLIMPTSNIHFSQQRAPNKLFNFKNN